MSSGMLAVERPALPPLQARPDRGGPGVDQWLLERAAADGCASAVWEPSPCLVVPGSYRHHAAFDAACERSAHEGWPVRLRRSGGGLVPQAAGVLNFSHAWRTALPMGDAMIPVYQALCALLQRVLAPFGLVTDCAAVAGSFCDGRYNLALDGRKVAGTAQYWQRLGPHEHVVLAHACLLVEADLAPLTERANRFEAALGSGRRYRGDVIANLAAPGLTTRVLMQRLGEAARVAGPLC
jgi:lipoate-protein ligase A